MAVGWQVSIIEDAIDRHRNADRVFRHADIGNAPRRRCIVNRGNGNSEARLNRDTCKIGGCHRDTRRAEGVRGSVKSQTTGKTR